MARTTSPYWQMTLIALPFLVLLIRPAAPVASLADEANGLVKTYSTALIGALKGAMEVGGPVGAIGACNTQAGPIAATLAEQSGWSIKRTSLKLRNPDSAPDSFERDTIAQFQARLAAGEPVSALTRAEIVTGADGGKVFRFAKAIPTAEMCTTCHGSDLKPQVVAKLNELYPADQAIGFKTGDLRGIFSLARTM
jgi:hypothetical protein